MSGGIQRAMYVLSTVMVVAAVWAVAWCRGVPASAHADEVRTPVAQRVAEVHVAAAE